MPVFFRNGRGRCPFHNRESENHSPEDRAYVYEVAFHHRNRSTDFRVQRVDVSIKPVNFSFARQDAGPK